MKKLIAALMVFSFSGAFLTSCEDDFDYYSTVSDNNGGGDDNTGGNGGNGNGDGSCFITNTYVDGVLTAEYFYDSAYTHVDSTFIYIPGSTTPNRLIYNYDNGVLVSLDTYSALIPGMESITSSVYTYNSDGAFASMVATTELMGSTSVVTSNYDYDPSEDCGMTGMTGTIDMMGSSLINISSDMEYIDDNCSFKMTTFKDGVYDGESNWTFEETSMTPAGFESPETNMFLNISGVLPSTITLIQDDGMGNMITTNMLMTYTFNAEGNIDQLTNVMTMDGQPITQVTQYNYVCP